jgi:hypothetical protein
VLVILASGRTQQQWLNMPKSLDWKILYYFVQRSGNY